MFSSLKFHPTILKYLTMAQKKIITQPKKTDRISDLPLDIIHDHILYFLPNKDIKVMSSLSKTWYHITNSFPYLVFDDSRFLTTNMFLKYVTKTLQRFHDHSFHLNKPRKLKICIRFCPKVAPVLDRWIGMALQHGVEELNLKITNHLDYSKVNPNWYDLPRSIFAAKSIKVAEISGCSLLQTFSREFVGSASGNLQQLTLDDVVLDEVTVSAIIFSCPLLEELRFSRSMGNMHRLRISNLPKLKGLRISNLRGKVDYPIVEIDAPSLENLEIDGGPKKFDLNYNLHLQKILSRLPSLRSLDLCNITLLTKLKLSSRTLSELQIWGNKNLVELKIDAPNLVSADYHGEFAPLLGSPMCRWNYVSSHYSGSQNPLIKVEDFLVDLINFFSTKKIMKYLSLSFSEINRGFNFKNLHKRIVEPAAKIDNLDVAFYGVGITDCINLLDCVLWICHPRTLSLRHFEPNDNNNYVVKQIYNLVVRRCRGPRCSCCRARERWVHHLQEIMSVNKYGVEDRLPLNGTSLSYFTRSCEKIKFIFKW